MKSLSHHILFAKPARRSQRGQGMVEFALILPLLLLLLVGIVELGRMLVIYSTVSAASREAARYGVGAGKNDDGLERYRDEDGMRREAERVALLSEITMDPPTYDSGPGTALKVVDEAEDVKLGDRINITVHARYEPILGLVPLWGFNIDSTTSRTILKEVSIVPFGNGENENGNENEDNVPPVVNILAPADQSDIDLSSGATINFLGEAPDTEDGDISSAIVWTSDVDGALGTGASINVGSLSEGTHRISATVTDSDGASYRAEITIYINTPPVVTIISPANNTEIEEGQQLTFSAVVSDYDPNLETTLEWIDGATQFGTGTPVTYAPMGVTPAEGRTIRACATDTKGLIGCAEITLRILAPVPPTLIITSPANNASFANGVSVTFVGEAHDNRDGNLSHLIRWTSSLDGALGTGASLSTNRLRVGTHTITASVTDTTNLTTTATIIIRIVDSVAPVVTINLPLAGVHFKFGDVVTFQGTASDTADGNLTNSLRWTSSWEGAIGTGGTFTFSRLRVGVHTIRAEVTDSSGLVGYATVVIYVDDYNTPPVVTITSPGEAPSPTVILRGRSLRFTGTAIDAQTGDLSSQIRWTSSRDGQLSVGATFTNTTLTVGLHTVTAAVTDAGGLSGQDTVQVQVNDFACPEPGAAYFRASSSSRYNGFVWNITLPSNSPLTIEYIMKSLVLTMDSNPGNAAIQTITVGGSQPVPFLASGTVVRAPQAASGTVWTGYFGSGGINIVYNFTNSIHRNNLRGSVFRVSAEFVGCPNAIQAIGEYR